jgi:hypothetical protein
MSVRVIGVISFGAAMAAIFLGNLSLTMMIREIKRKRQDGDLILMSGLRFRRSVEFLPA